MSEKKEEKLPEISVRRDKKNFVTIGFVGELSVKVYPGVTRIKDQDVLKAIANKKFNGNWLAFIDNKVHEIVTGKQEKSKKDTTVFTAMVADDSIKMVRETLSIPALEAMYSDEQSSKGRKTILAAIDDQIEELKKPLTKEDADK